MNTLAVSSQIFFQHIRPMKMEGTGCSKTSEHKVQNPKNRAKEGIQHSEHDECLKSKISIKNMANLLVIRCKYLQNARYAQVKINPLDLELDI